MVGDGVPHRMSIYWANGQVKNTSFYYNILPRCQNDFEFWTLIKNSRHRNDVTHINTRLPHVVLKGFITTCRGLSRVKSPTSNVPWYQYYRAPLATEVQLVKEDKHEPGSGYWFLLGSAREHGLTESDDYNWIEYHHILNHRLELLLIDN